MVWITSGNGLVRYDSKTFHFFKHQSADSNSIASNFTDQMAGDIKGRLWVVTDKGLDMFDPQTEKFSHCYITKDGKPSRDFIPESLLYDSLGNRIWAGTWQGLYYCDATGTEFVKARTDAESASILQRVFIDIKPGPGGTLWLCNNEGVYQYNPRTGHTEIFHIGENGTSDEAFCLYPENDETLWVGTWTKGLVRFDVLSKSTQRFYYSDYTKNQNGVVAIVQTGLPEEKDILWLSTMYPGLASFDKKKGTFQFYHSESENDKNGIKGLTNRLLPTATEGMWIASENGLHRYDYAKQLFRSIDFVSLKPSLHKAFPPAQLSIRPSARGSDSLFYFHVPYEGSYIYNAVDGKLGTSPAALKQYQPHDGYAYFTDATGIYWAGAKQYGLIGYDLNKNKLVFSDNKLFVADREGLKGFYEDPDNRLWMATYNGLFMMDKDRKKVIPVHAINDQLTAKGLSLNIQGITADDSGRIWITASGSNKHKNVIAVYYPSTSAASFFFPMQNKTRGFPDEAGLNNIAVCGQQAFVATNAGLLKFSITDADPVFTLLNHRNGLTGDNLTQVLRDKHSNIWCATDFGVSCYLPSKDFFINYTHAHSGIGPVRTPEMFLSPNTGYIYFSQRGGFNYLDPSQISIEAAPRTYFTEMLLFNKPFLYNEKRLQAGDIIRLPYDQNMISVSFTGMSYSNPGDNQFAYMLEGLEKEWNISKNNIAAYTNLAPGTYRLLVKTSNSSGVWTPEPSVITFIIRPPFWKTWWFLSLIILSVAALLYALYRYRIKQLLRLQQMRNSISRNLHDEIGSTLTSINILSNVSKQAMDKEPGQAKKMLQKISEQSKTIQQNMSDIVWAIRSDNDKAENLLVRMREYAAQTLEPLKIQTTISEGPMPGKPITPEVKKELLLIFKEAINNIAKHAGATEVTIRLQKINNGLQLAIKDNGRWKGNGKTSGTGLGSMRQRAASLGGNTIISHADEGTTVLTQIPLT